jgi:MFS family permease
MARTPPILRPLRERDFRLLWTGTAVSLLGDGIFLVGLAWAAYSLKNTPTALSVVGFAMTLPQVVFLLIGGVVSDRFDRRRVLMAADTVRGATLAAFAALAAAGSLTLPLIVALACVYGVATAFYGPAFDALVPGLVPEHLLAPANSLDQLVRPIAARLVGPAAGGALIAAFGTSSAFAIDAASFAVSVVCVKLVAARPVAVEDTAGDGDGSIFAQCRSGFRLIRSQVWLWGTFLSATFAYMLFVGPSEVLLPYVVKNNLHASAGVLGAVLAVGGAGAILAAVLMSHRRFPRRHMTFIYGTWTIATLAIAGYGIATHAWQLAVACFVFNGLEAAGTIVWITTKQRLVPAAYLGRVSSLDWFISIGLLPLSYALTGPIAGLIGVRTTLIGAGVIGAAMTGAFLFLPGMRALEPLDDDAATRERMTIAAVGA